MAKPVQLSVSGNNLAYFLLPSDAQIDAILGVADTTDALDVGFYYTKAKPAGTGPGDVPADAVEFAGMRTPINESRSLPMGPDGIALAAGVYVIALFNDAGTKHQTWFYWK